MVENGWAWEDLIGLTDAQFFLFQRTHLHLARLGRQAQEDAKGGKTRRPM